MSIADGGNYANFRKGFHAKYFAKLTLVMTVFPSQLSRFPTVIDLKISPVSEMMLPLVVEKEDGFLAQKQLDI